MSLVINKSVADIKVPKDRMRPVGDLSRLLESLKERGLINPITVDDQGVLIAGAHRLAAAKKLGWETIAATIIRPKSKDKDTRRLELRLIEIDENLIREDLTALQQGRHLKERKRIYELLHPETVARVAQGVGEKKAHGKLGPKNGPRSKSFLDDTAAKTKKSRATIHNRLAIADLPEAVQKLVTGTDVEDRPTDLLALTKVKDPKKQIEAARMLADGDASSTKQALREIRRDDARRTIAAEPAPLPGGRHRVLVADPPWAYEKRKDDGSHRTALSYPDMTTDEICALPVAESAHDDCVLWLWTTNAFMRDAFRVLDAWGFKEKTILTWVKDKMGTGDWLRGKTEHCVMAVRGKPTINLTNQTTVLNGPRREHSRKPDEFYDLVEELCPGSKMEMFARETRAGWAAWGAEKEQFNAGA